MRRASTRAAYTPGSLREAESSDEEEETEDAGQAAPNQPAGSNKRAKKVHEPKPPPTPDIMAPLCPGAAMPGAIRRKKPAAGTPAASLSLFELLACHPEEAGNAAKAWVSRYQDDQTTATAELLTLLVQAAGVPHAVSNEEVEEMDADEMGARLRKLVMEEGGFEPFSNKRTKGLKAGFPAFWLSFIEELHGAERLVSPTTGNTDDFVLEKLKDLAVVLSLQVVRSFRTAATLCAAQLVSSIVGVRKHLLDALAQVLQQRDAEQKKGSRANKAQLATVQRQVDSYHRQDDSLNALVDGVIKSIFAVRFRDVAPSIRALVISSFGQWIKIGPATFLSDAYLKYLGWALSDRDAAVRAAAINALKDLYADTENAAGMRDFKGRFLARMMELPYDISEGVAVMGMELLSMLVQQQEVSHTELREVYGLLADGSPFIREAAAVLAAQMLEAEAAERAQGNEHAPPAGKAGTKGGKRGTKGAGKQECRGRHATSVAVLLDVMAWMRQGGSLPSPTASLPLSAQAVSLLVDSLFSKFPALQDSSALASALDDETLAGDSIHGLVHAAHAAMLLAASLQRAQQGSSSSAAGTGKGPRAKAAAPNTSLHQDASLALIGTLPTLIRKHQTQAAVIAPLCQCVRLLRLELFALRNEERAYGDLLTLVADQIFRHTDLGVATQAVDTLVFCSRSGPGMLQPIARLALTSAVSKAAQGLSTAQRAVMKLPSAQLQAQVEELEGAGEAAAEAAPVLWRLQTALTRCQALLSRGAALVAGQATDTMWAPLSQLMEHCGAADGTGLLGVRVTSQLVHAAHTLTLAGLTQLKHQAPEEGHQAHTATGNGTAAAAAAAATAGTSEDEKEQREGQQGAAAGSKRGGRSRGKGGRGKQKAAGKKRSAAAAEEEEGEQQQQQQEQEQQQGQGGAAVEGLSVESVSARADELAVRLMAVFDAAEESPAVQVVVNRAMVDLLLLFGHNTWQGTALEGCRLSVDMGAYLERCWLGCDTAFRMPQDTLLTVNQAESQGMDSAGEAEEGQQIKLKILAMQRRLIAVGGLVRLLLSHALPPSQKDALALRLMSQFTSYGPEVEEMVRDIAVELRRRKHQVEGAARGLSMADLNVEAMKHSFKEVLDTLEAPGADSQEEVDLGRLSAALHSFSETASAIASMYAGVGLSRDELMSLLRGGARYALAADSEDATEALPRMYFLAWGLEPFIPKLAPEDAATLVRELEGLAASVAAAPGAPSMQPEEEGEGDPQWMQYHHFMEQLQAQAAKATTKGRGRGALKGARARMAASTPPHSPSPSMSPDQDQQPDQDQEGGAEQEQWQEEEEQEEEEQGEERGAQQLQQQQRRPLQQQQQQQPRGTFGRRSGAARAQQAPAAQSVLADEEAFDDVGGSLEDGSAPPPESAQLPRFRPSQQQAVDRRGQHMRVALTEQFEEEFWEVRLQGSAHDPRQGGERAVGARGARGQGPLQGGVGARGQGLPQQEREEEVGWGGAEEGQRSEEGSEGPAAPSQTTTQTTTNEPPPRPVRRRRW